MVALFLIGLLATFAWLAGMDWLVYVLLSIILLFIISVLLTMAGVSKRRATKAKYHPPH